ncbi:MAG: T9SS type A sorting domain-containing protein [Candidatus Latescibacter sp.]|nr:T9SS type A sorting domain-containing protein [Candidatus Latescibacter sp.]
MRIIGIIIGFLWLASLAFGGTTGKIILTTSDYISGNTASYDIGKGTLSDGLLGHFQDSYVKTYGRNVYIIEGGDNSNIIKLDMDNLKTPLYQYSTVAGANPHDLVFVPTAKYLKGYVIRYGKPSIWVVNLDAANSASFKLGEIDISAWNDADGSPEAHLGYYYGGYVYVVLQRYDLKAYAAGTGVLIKIDPVTDTIVDLDPNTPGIQGVDFIRKNPVGGALAGNLLYLAGTTYGASDEGVWSVDLDNPKNGQRVVAAESTLGGSAGGIFVFGPEYAVVNTYDANYNMAPRPMNPATGAFLPSLPVPDSGGGIVSAGGLLYIGSRDKKNPALYVVDPKTNKVTAGPFPTSLPPLTMAYVDGAVNTAVRESEPASFAISSVYPNPFNPRTTIAFTLNRAAEISLAIYTSTGQKAAELVRSPLEAGRHTVVWDASGYATGVYVVRLTDGKHSVFTKCMVMK